MSTNLRLTLACGDYEITRPLMDGRVKPAGIDLIVITPESRERHWRVARDHAYDICEFNTPAYFMGRDRGLPYVSLPIYLHRRFRHGFVFINTQKGITKPTDLIGRKIGIKSFLVTAGHWMRGILEHEYGVPHKSIQWFAELDEDIEFTPHKDLNITRLPHNRSVETMLAEGELDAVIHSSIIKPILNKDPRVGRLWPDYKAEEARFFAKTGIFPIMHVMGIKQEIVDKHPWVPINMFQAFQKAKAIAMSEARKATRKSKK